MQNEKTNIKFYDLIIIGAGWNGLLMCKHALQNKLKVLIVDSRETIGGSWKYSPDNKIKSVTKNTITTYSKTFNEISDFPMPSTYPLFPSHHEIYSYLVAYAKKFNLMEHIQFKSWIVSAEKISEGNYNFWKLKDSSGKNYISTCLSVCCGKQGKPKIPTYLKKQLKSFKGELINGETYKYLTPKFLNKKILVIGSNNKTSQIVSELSNYGKKIYWVIENGQWFLPRLAITPVPKESSIPLDGYYNVLNYSLFNDKKRKGIYFIEDMIELSYGKSGHGIKEWVSTTPLKHGNINRNREVLTKISDGVVIPKKKIKSINGKKIIFNDLEEQNIDLIVINQDPLPNFTFLPLIHQKPIHKNYKYIFDPLDPTLSFIGYIQPNLGAVASIAELQAMYASKVYSGQINLPDKQKMVEVAKRDSYYWSNYFKNQKSYYVDLELYSTDLAKKINVYPDYTKLFFSSPLTWWKCITAPYNNCRYLLNDSKHRPQILSTYSNYKNYQLDISWYLSLIIKPFYYAIRDQFSSKESNSIVSLEDKHHQEKKKKRTNYAILIIVCIGILLLVPEWKNGFINHIGKLRGDVERYDNKIYLTIVVFIVLFLLYSKK
ncbi:Flavin-binding monooxygenase-like [seawater metagenome]|uniref:Flavin-binding monooxygenase-like n=1 Tax=seawater metagenome TaxID=1561972 RepID=A0A5E8CH78_9ZZZZ